MLYIIGIFSEFEYFRFALEYSELGELFYL